MLCPDVNYVLDDLAQAYYAIMKVDSFAYASRNTLIGQLSPDPAWLAPIRNELAMLSNEGGLWQLKKPDYWGPILSAFPVYSASFDAFAGITDELGDHKDHWVQLLTDLRNSLNNNAIASRASEGLINQHIKNLINIETLLSNSLDIAWGELDNEEKKMIDLAKEITDLQNKIDGLSSGLSAKEISAGTTYISSTASITYAVLVTADLSMPYLTIASLIFTTGKMAFDLIENDAEIRDKLDQIDQKRREASYQAVAAAMTKGVIQLINSFDKSLSDLKNQMPQFSRMWESESDKIQQVIDAIHAGVDPSSFFDLFTMSSAAETWKQISGFVTKLSFMVPTLGTPVYLTPGKNPIGTTLP